MSFKKTVIYENTTALILEHLFDQRALAKIYQIPLHVLYDPPTQTNKTTNGFGQIKA